MPLDVCLIKLPTVLAPKSVSYFGTVLPLGLAYVAAAARAGGHRVAVVDAPGAAMDRFAPWPTDVGELVLHGLGPEELAAGISPETRVVGIGHMFLHEWPLLRETVRAVRAARPGVILVVGGENATGMWERILDEAPEVDACVLGEGEATFVALLNALERGEALHGVTGLALRGADGRPFSTGRAQRLRSLDALSRPAWDLFPVEAYLDAGCGSGVDRGRTMPMVTSRGCPFRCTFCSAPLMWTTRYEARSPDDVADEVAALQARYGVTNIDFCDLTAVLTKAWILDLCAVIERRGLRFTWQLPSGTRSEAIDAEAARALRASGCHNFGYAPESGSPRMLKRVNKKVALDRLEQSVADALTAGLTVHANFIVGFPDETWEDVAATLRFLARLALLGMHSVSVMTFSPYPGSEDYARLQSQIMFDDEYIYGSLFRSGGRARSYNPSIGSSELLAAQAAAFATFFGVQFARRPGRAVALLSNLARGRQETALDKFVSAKLAQLRR